MEEPILKAEGIQTHVELLQDRVQIKRKGPLAKRTGNRDIPTRSIASLEFVSPSWFSNGYNHFVLRGQEPRRGSWARSQDPYTVDFRDGKRAQFEELKQAIEEQIAERRGPAEVRDEAVLEAPNGADAPVSKVAGSADILNNKLRKLAEQNMSQDETIEFCLLHPNPPWSQAIVALNDRLLVLKPGLMAGATFGARVTSFYYRDITGIEVNTGLINGVIEINTPSYQGTGQKDFWNIRNEDKDPYKVTNCLPIFKPNLKDYKPYIDRLRARIREEKLGHIATPVSQSRNNPSSQPETSALREADQEQTTPTPKSGMSISSELEKLASLRDSGVLTEDEFQQAKKRVLG